MSEKNIIIIRHFETFEDTNKNEKINYEKSLIKSPKYIEYIIKYINDNPNINKIKFYTSKYDRTIMTSLILCNGLKSQIILNKLKTIKIYDPIITDILNRDPHKKNHKEICNNIKNSINDKLKDDTLYLFVSHSSLIYNLFECLCKLYSSKYKGETKNRIHTYSLSFIKKTKNSLKYDFNVNMK